MCHPSSCALRVRHREPTARAPGCTRAGFRHTTRPEIDHPIPDRGEGGRGHPALRCAGPAVTSPEGASRDRHRGPAPADPPRRRSDVAVRGTRPAAGRQRASRLPPLPLPARPGADPRRGPHPPGLRVAGGVSSGREAHRHGPSTWPNPGTSSRQAPVFRPCRSAGSSPSPAARAPSSRTSRPSRHRPWWRSSTPISRGSCAGSRCSPRAACSSATQGRPRRSEPRSAWERRRV